MSRVVRFHRFGGPEVIGLNRPEQMFRSGSYVEQSTLSAHNGYEASAIVPIHSLGKRPITWSRKPTTERSSSPCDPTPDAQSFPQRSVNYIQ